MRSTIVQAVWQVLAAAALTLAVAPPAHAQAADARAAGAPDPDDPFARRGWHLELGGHGALETWNYNISHEELYGLRSGLTYGLRNGLTLVAGSPLYYVSQRTTDGYVMGATLGVRGRVYRRRHASAFLDFEVGVSEADTPVPPRGTRFNYLVLGGAGATFRLRPGLHVLVGLKWIHISNNGLAGRDRNPDIEAVGPHASLLIRF